ncbi:MAG: hypothetical protein AB7S77_23385, partial [Desulfatirhabdiaceae bacterium]
CRPKENDRFFKHTEWYAHYAFRMSIDEEGILKFSTFLTSYEKVGFAKQLDLCENSLKIFFADEDVKKLIGIS